MVFVLEDIDTIKNNRKIDASRTKTLEILLPDFTEARRCSKILKKTMNAGDCFDLFGYTEKILREAYMTASSFN